MAASTSLRAVLLLCMGIGIGLLLSPLLNPSPSEVVVPELRPAEQPGEIPAGIEVPGEGEAVPPRGDEITKRTAMAGVGSQGADPILGTVIYGRVVDQEGKPVTRINLNFTSQEDPSQRVHASVHEGRYVAHSLRPGRWQLRIRGTGFKDVASEAEVPDRATFRADFTVQRAILVTVRAQLPDGSPMSAALEKAGVYSLELNVIATRHPELRAPLTDMRYHTRLGLGRWVDGGFMGRAHQVKDDPDVIGRVELDEPPPAYFHLMNRHVTIQSKELQAGVEEILFQCSLEDLLATMARVQLRVIGAVSGAPIEGARVSISDRQSSNSGQKTGSDGRVVLANQKPGLVEIDIYAKGRERYFVRHILPSGEADLGDIRLSPAHTIRGRVLGPDGKPCAGNLTWSNLQRRSFPQPLTRSRAGGVNSKGEFELSWLGAGRYLIQVSAGKDAGGQKVIDTRSLGPDPVVIRLSRLVEVVFDNGSQPRDRIRTIEVRTRSGELVWARYLRTPIRYRCRLAEGQYSYAIFDGRAPRGRGEFVVGTKGGGPIRL